MEDNDLTESILIDPAILYWGTPVVLVSTVNEDGTANLAPMSSAWWLGRGCMLGFTESAKSVKNLRRTKECVLNLPSSSLAGAVDRIARTTGNNPVPPDKEWLGFEYVADKFGRAGLTPVPSTIVAAPRAAECDVQMEAAVEIIHAYGATNPGIRTKIAAIELRIVAVHVNPDIVHKDDSRRVDPDLWRPLIMSFREFYGLGDRVTSSRLAEISEERWRPPPPA
ncbi:MAG: flavin reductase family protein [Rhodospirillaceae bacterium]|jgi:flavin reductase (DIM6/NTAB) family NADH-FMN oxidoreductase RutF|nr:flavin reductase family protein [Rhodospirillaceae bacterium]MBT4046194.1 flavin reductase family protein [Rhodospirillaceae bacterium]MBT4690627.1 flavin reductase family protein [Rhodospirillaceae bacterium]MBT5080577.1 flavin reductase family protein [Rhodospirillaceae bacterium]MBT5526554.1 flavin reductase family protein [Rhodospirillaceae bacterium]